MRWVGLGVVGCLLLVGCAEKSAGSGASDASPAASGMAKSTPPAATATSGGLHEQGTTIEPMPTSAPPKPIARQDKSGGDGDQRKGGEKLRDEAEDLPPPPPPPPKLGAPGGSDGKVMSSFTTDVEGKLSESDIQATMDGLAPRMQRCLSKDATVEVSLKVTAGGEATNVNVTRSAPDDPVMRDCLKSAIVAARFKQPTGGQAVGLKLTLSLKKDLKY